MRRRVALLVHGAWVNSRCWGPLRARLEDRGIECIAPDWPYKDREVEALRERPDPRLATLGIDELVEHYARHVRACPEPPLLVGHSLGGLVVQMLLDRDLGRGAVALCPAPPRGILPLQPSVLRTSLPMLSRPRGWRRLMHMRFSDWQWGFVAPLPPEEQQASFERFVVPESGRIWFQLALSLANGLAGVSFRASERAPLLLVAGTADRVTPCSMVRANHRAYRSPTEYLELPGRPHWVLGEHDAVGLAERIDRFAAPLWDAPPRRAPLSRPSRPGRCTVAIVGAGPTGLACGASLRQRGIDSVIFDGEPEVGQSWRRHYQRLHLHTTRALSSLPGLPIPRSWGRWIAADDFATYLERYARHHHLTIAPSTRVLGLRGDARGDGWQVQTERGAWQAERVIVATGLNRVPYVPPWPGREQFRGTLLHSSEYREPGPYRDRDVLVVGSGNSGAEIAYDLATGGARRVRLAVRTGPNVLPRSILGLPTQVTGVVFERMPARVMDAVLRGLQRLLLGDLTRLGLPRPPRGLFTQVERDHAVPIIDVGLVEQLAARRVEVVAGVEALEGSAVRLCDGEAVEPEVVIAATGFRPELGPLLGPELELDEQGLPQLSSAAEVIEAPGLYLAGCVVSVAGVLRAIARQSQRIAAAIAASGTRSRGP